MKQTLWKHALSYITDLHIESTSSDYNAVLDLFYVKGRYQLCTENAIYSYADKYDNFFETFKVLNLKNRKYNNVLLLGLGLGSIPYMLERKFDLKYQYTAVEIDEEVIYLASKYVLDELKSEVQIVGADAATFLQLDDTIYDMICMDVFQDDSIPEIFEEEDFLEMLKESLTKDGLLIYNRLYLTDNDKNLTDTFFIEKFKKIFPNATTIISGGNKMLLS